LKLIKSILLFLSLSLTLILFLSLSLSFSLFAIAPLWSVCRSLSLSLSHSVSLFLQLHLSEVSVVLSLSFSLFLSLPPTTCRVCSRRVEERRTKNDRPEYDCVMFVKCSALSIGLDLSKPVDRRDESFQTDSVCPRVSFTLPEGKQNSVAPFRCWFET
jgi:hypothetical protein